MNESKVPEWLLKASDRIIEHMNDDHSNSIISTKCSTWHKGQRCKNE